MAIAPSLLRNLCCLTEKIRKIQKLSQKTHEILRMSLTANMELAINKNHFQISHFHNLQTILERKNQFLLAEI